MGERGEQHDDEHEEPLLSIDEPLWRRRLKVKVESVTIIKLPLGGTVQGKKRKEEHKDQRELG